MRFANLFEWTPDDRKTKYTGFRTYSNIYATREKWKPVEPELWPYQQTMSKTSLDYKNIEHVLFEMGRYMKHYENGDHTWS